MDIGHYLVPLKVTYLRNSRRNFLILFSEVLRTTLGQRQLCWDVLKLDDTVKFFNLLLKCNLLAESILHMIIVRQFIICCLEEMQMRHDDVIEYGDRGRRRGVDCSVKD